MASKDQFMISVDMLDRDRLDALRIVMGVSRAEAARQALQRKGLAGLEAQFHPRLNRLYGVARDRNVPWETMVRELADRPDNKQKMPSLEELEAAVAKETMEQVAR